MNHTTVILHMSLIDGVGATSIKTVVANKPSDCNWHNVYTFMPSDFIELGLKPDTAATLVAGLRDKTLLDLELNLLHQHGIEWVSLGDLDYPELLTHIGGPPPILYWQGRTALNQFKKTIAMVGSRKADAYGARVVSDLVPSLVAHNWTVVSGGALGVDSMAHSTTLKHNGSTIAVLGSGLLHPYPTNNIDLFQKIIDSDGAVVSPFPLKTPPKPSNFPARNRVISGLSHGCIVIQAARKSGALITAHYALEQGREVFAVPGMIDHELSTGCHDLIQAGAKLVMHTQDILAEFGEHIQNQETTTASNTGTIPANKARTATASNIGATTITGTIDTVTASNTDGAATQATINFSTTKKKQTQQPNSNRSSNNSSPVKPIITHPYAHDSIQAHIIALCNQPCSVDDLITHLTIDLSQIQKILFDMQLDGTIKQDFTGRWTTQ